MEITAMATAGRQSWFLLSMAAALVVCCAARAQDTSGKPSADATHDGEKPKEPAPAMSRALKIVTAAYGNAEAYSTCQVTEAVRRRCQGRSRCAIEVNDELCSTPSILTGLIRSLSVTYLCHLGDTPLHHTTDKPYVMNLKCS
jgi:hypothetical protein